MRQTQTRSARPSWRFFGGFSTLEFTNGFSAFALFVTAGATGLQDFVADIERTTVVNQMVTGLRMARHAADKYSANVTVCPSADGWTCSGGSDWTPGWVAFLDHNRDGEMNAVERSGVVARARNDGSHVSVVSDWDRFTFKPGMPVAVAADDAAATVCFSDARGPEQSRVIWIDARGNARVHPRRPDRELRENAQRDFSHRSTDCY